MRAIDVTITVLPDGEFQLEGLADLPPGKHQAVLVVENGPIAPERRVPLAFRTYPVGLVAPNETFRREDIYGDDGR